MKARLFKKWYVPTLWLVKGPSSLPIKVT